MGSGQGKFDKNVMKKLEASSVDNFIFEISVQLIFYYHARLQLHSIDMRYISKLYKGFRDIDLYCNSGLI